MLISTTEKLQIWSFNKIFDYLLILHAPSVLV